MSLVTALAFMQLASAQAAPLPTEPVAVADAHQLATVSPPYSALEYCFRTRDPGCVVDRITPMDLAYINAEVSEAIETREDDDYLDQWTPFPRDADGHIRGDCDDDAATKRAALIGIGFNARAMHFEIGEVIEPDGRRVGHMVLVVTLGPDEWVMDRKTPTMVYKPRRRPYQWAPLARQSQATVNWEAGG